MHNDPFTGINSTLAAAVSETNQGSIVVRVNPEWVSNISERTRPYKNFPEKARPALEKVADYVRTEMIPRTFKNEGPGWRKLARRTRRERTELGYGATGPILIRTRDLFNELTNKQHPKHVEVIKTGKYARVSVGGSSEKFVRNQGGNSVYHIPSRPMIPGTGWLPLPARDRQAIKRILEESIRKELKRG